MDKVKVLRLIARLNIGGPAQHVIFLTESLDPHKYDSVLVYGALDKGEGDMSYLANERGIKTIFIPEFGRNIAFFSDLSALIAIYKVIKKEKPVIVHTHTAKAGTLGRIAAILAGVPIKIHTYHGHVFHGYFSSLVSNFFIWIERALAHFTDRIVVISANQKDEILKKYKIGNESKFEIINLGFEMDRFLCTNSRSGILRDKYSFTEGHILVGIVGRLVPVKDIAMFIDAVKILKDKLVGDGRNVKYVIIGDGPGKDDLLKQVIESGLKEDVFFEGWMKDIDKAYADLDIVALTSKNEGTPLSLIEAMASAKPVISTDVGGVRDVVGEAGILVQKGDKEAFAAGLLGLVMNKEKRLKIAQDARARVMVKYSKINLINNIDSLYARLLAKKGIRA